MHSYHKQFVRRQWIDQVLGSHPDAQPDSVAEWLLAVDTALRCEPGRSMLDGYGLTLANVAFSKPRSDGVPLVGLHMNETQFRSTSAEFLLDPILLHATEPPRERTPLRDILVGASCIEEELLLRRRFGFPLGIMHLDIVYFPNTADYPMHIVERASHHFPLAHTVLGLWRLGSRWH